MHFLFTILLFFISTISASQAQDSPLQEVLQSNKKAVERASRKTVGAVIDELLKIDDPSVPKFLGEWQSKNVWMRKADGLFVYAKKSGAQYQLIDLETGVTLEETEKSAIKQLKPNAGVRGVIAGILVRFQLSDPDPAIRKEGLEAIARKPNTLHLEPLRASIDGESELALLAQKQRLERLLTITFGKNDAERLEAINGFENDLGLDVRGTLNKLVQTKLVISKGDSGPQNIKRRLQVGSDLSLQGAYDILVSNKLARARITTKQRNEALIANTAEGKIVGLGVETLDREVRRNLAYSRLAATGTVPPSVSADEMDKALAAVEINEVYLEGSSEITTAAEVTLARIENLVGYNQAFDLALDGLSLASIYFLAAIGLAITFGVMGVINMAHGEFIMMGAYTGYVVQLFIPDYTVSILVALPLAFAVTFAAGVLMERLVIRHLAHRPLETLLATFGISIALQQIAKNIFGTQARPLTSPHWLDGAWVLNDVVSISYIRIAIFVLALIFLFLLLYILNRTRLGLEVRAVTQNPKMAASMGINPDKVNMLTFGLGSGIAGIAGVAIGLFAKVTSELGSAYIVQSFMTVVVGGVGNIWGTLAGAGMIGSLQKLIEWFNPSNTLAAQTYMIIFIIIFIQFRPKGLIALKGRAAGD